MVPRVPVIFPQANMWMPFVVGAVYFGIYLGLTGLFYSAHRNRQTQGFFARNGVVDVVTSLALVGVTLWLIVHVIWLAAHQFLTFPFLLAYYGLFVLLFSGVYSLIEWHFPRSLENAAENCWETELQCLILGLQPMATLGPTRATPRRYLAELVACAQAILGIFFIGVFVARWVNTLSPNP